MLGLYRNSLKGGAVTADYEYEGSHGCRRSPGQGVVAASGECCWEGLPMALKEPHAVLEVLSRLEGLRTTEPQGAACKRQFVRQVVRGDAELWSCDEGLGRQSIAIQLRDVSWGGLGFLCTQPLDADSLWRVHFLQRSQIVGHVTLLVRHCRRVDEDLYLIGGQAVIDPGLMLVLGADVHNTSTTTAKQAAADTLQADFLPPAEVA